MSQMFVFKKDVFQCMFNPVEKHLNMTNQCIKIIQDFLQP